MTNVEHGVLEGGDNVDFEHGVNLAETLANKGGSELKILKVINDIFQKRINEVERLEGDLEVKFETFLCFSII